MPPPSPPQIALIACVALVLLVAPRAAAQGPTFAPEVDQTRTAYDFAPDEPCPFCEITPQFPRGPVGLHWHAHWERVGLREYIATPALLLAGIGTRYLPDDPPSAGWTGGILLDDWTRNNLVFKSDEGRQRAQRISDVLMYLSIVHPVIIDNFAVAWFGKERPDVAWQMFVINAQAYALTFALNSATKRLTRRERPFGERCREDPDAPYDCEGTERYRSFYSGHSAFTATGAGLLCAHHTQLQLYRSPAADTATCVAGILATAATGMLRISSDYHWASDVAVGHLMGYVSGYLLPTLLYYREFRVSPEPIDEHDPPAEPQMAVLPLVTQNSLQLSLFGLF